MTEQNIALKSEQLDRIKPVLQELETNQLIWLSGYVAGMANAGTPAQSQPQAASQSAETVTILYASQTGNAKEIAQQLQENMTHRGLTARVTSMGALKAKQLKNEKWLVAIASTHGNGEPPEDAMDFYEQLFSKKAPDLSSVNFAVVGLGDSSYEHFCSMGKVIDARFEELGGTRFSERLDCDVDYEDQVAAWQSSFIEKIEPQISTSDNVIPMSQGQPAPQRWSKSNPFPAELLTNQKITARESSQDVRHIELSLEESGIQYQPGDSIGIKARNHPEVVRNILQTLEIDPDTRLTQTTDGKRIEDALTDDYELTLLHPGFFKAWGTLIGDDNLANMPRETINTYLVEHQVVDIITQFPAPEAVSPDDFVSCLRKLTPRLYSISSSPDACEDEVHITVALIEYEAFGFAHYGHASSYLTRLEDDAAVSVYISENDHFRLPENGDTPVIMIGAGTGIAPYRAFLQQREYNGDKGANWLFFGTRHARSDFLYQAELLNYRDKGVLNRLNAAFSRDQEEKIYVQHLVEQQGEEVYQWLESGAHLYICGAIQMGDEVHKALVNIVQRHGQCDHTRAENYLNELRKARRYKKDVY